MRLAANSNSPADAFPHPARSAAEARRPPSPRRAHRGCVSALGGEKALYAGGALQAHPTEHTSSASCGEETGRAEEEIGAREHQRSPCTTDTAADQIVASQHTTSLPR